MALVILLLNLLLVNDAGAAWLKTPVQGSGTATDPWRPVLHDADGKPFSTAFAGKPVYLGQNVPQFYCVWVNESLAGVKLGKDQGLISRGEAQCQFDPRVHLDQFEKLPKKTLRQSILHWLKWITNPVSAWATSSTDNFNRANSSDLGADWTPYLSHLNIASNAVIGQSGYNADVEIYTAVTPTNDQYAQVDITTLTGAEVCTPGLMLRQSSSGDGSLYLISAYINAGIFTTNIFTWTSVAGFVSIASENSTTWGAGQQIRATIQGTDITAFQDGSSVLTVSDASFSSGSAGLLNGCETTQGNSVVDNFTAGDLADLNGGGVARRRIINIP